MSKTDKENKENKENSDISNLMVLNQDFSYNKDEQNIYYIDDIVYGQEINSIQDEINELTISNELKNYHLDSFINYDEKKEIAEGLNILLKTSNLKSFIEENLKNYNDFLSQLSEISELNYYYNTLKKISDSGEIFKNHFYNNLESFRSQLKSIDNQIFINIFVKKVIEIFIDLLFNIPDIKEAASQTKLKAVISFARRMKFVPYLGILSLIVDIVMILIEIRQEKEEIHEIINDCALLESFYSNLSNEVSCIMSGGIVNYDQLCELKNDRVYLYNALSVYRKNHNNIYCNPISLYEPVKKSL